MQQHRARAIAHAERRAAELMQAGDTAGHAVWLRIGVANGSLFPIAGLSPSQYHYGHAARIAFAPDLPIEPHHHPM